MKVGSVSLAAVSVIAAGAMWMGWRSTQESSELAIVLAGRTSPPSIAKPGWQAVAAIRALRAASPEPAAAEVADRRSLVSVPPPLEPAIEAVFRQDLSAVVRRDRVQEPELLMHSLGAAHLLKTGDIYRDRWRLVTLTSSDATLKRGAEVRTVKLFSPAALPVQSPPPSAEIPAPSITAGAANPRPAGEGPPSIPVGTPPAVWNPISGPFPGQLQKGPVRQPPPPMQLIGPGQTSRQGN